MLKCGVRKLRRQQKSKVIMKISIWWSALPAVILSACSSVSVDSNLNPRNFSEYFKASTVETVSYADLAKQTYALLGRTHGLSCQRDSDDFPANESDARTDLKRKAADMGANALVIHKCVRAQDTGACALSVTCYGDAIYVPEEQ